MEILAHCNADTQRLSDNWEVARGQFVLDCFWEAPDGNLEFMPMAVGAFLVAEHLMQSDVLLDPFGRLQTIDSSIFADRAIVVFVNGWMKRADRVGGPNLASGVAGRAFELVVCLLTLDPSRIDASALAFAKSLLKHGLSLSIEIQALIILAWSISILRRKNCQMFLGSMLAAILVSSEAAIRKPNWSLTCVNKLFEFPLWLFLRCFEIVTVYSEYGRIALDLSTLITMCESEIRRITGTKVTHHDVKHLAGVKLDYTAADICSEIDGCDSHFERFLRYHVNPLGSQ